MEALKIKFEKELRSKMAIAKSACRYNPSYFNQMLSEIGGVATAKRLIAKAIATGNPSDGFTTLLLNGRTDLTVEDSVCNPEYAELFEDFEIEYCKTVLQRQ